MTGIGEKRRKEGFYGSHRNTINQTVALENVHHTYPIKQRVQVKSVTWVVCRGRPVHQGLGNTHNSGHVSTDTETLREHRTSKVGGNVKSVPSEVRTHPVIGRVPRG